MKKLSNTQIKTLLAIAMIVIPALAIAQGRDLGTALNQINSQIISYKNSIVDTTTNIAYVIAFIFGIVGGVRVYNKFQSGDQDASKSLVNLLLGLGAFIAVITIIKVVFV